MPTGLQGLNASNLPAVQTVRQLIDSRALQNPHKLFLEAAETGLSLSYLELQQKCRSIARLLEHKGIGHGETVAFLMDNGLWTTCLFLGVMYSGRVVLPLNAVAGPDQLGYVIAHSQLKLLFCSAAYRVEYADCLRQGSHFECLIEDEDKGAQQDLIPLEPVIAGQPEITQQDTALIIYTSGTTGRPKGVLLSHRNVIAGGRNTVSAHELHERDKGLCVLPLYHINAEMVSVMATLVSNSAVVMAKKFSARNFWSWIGEYRCTWFSVVPTIISWLIERRQRQTIGNDDPQCGVLAFGDHVRFGRSASAALAPSTHRQFEALFNIPIIETMGISECAAQILSAPLHRKEVVYGSAGLPVGNEVAIFDENCNDCADRAIGEIVVRGDNVMKGYLNDPQATREALDENGWFHTGDLGYRNEQGYIFVTGRLRELIIRGGENIAPRQIDDVLYRHPDVFEAAAFGVPDVYYGQEVAACVTLRANVRCSEAQLLDHCRRLLGETRCPKTIYIRDQLPKGPSGKIQRLKLAQLLSQVDAAIKQPQIDYEKNHAKQGYQRE